MASKIILTVPNERADEFGHLLFEEHPEIGCITSTETNDFHTKFIIEDDDEDLESWLEILLHNFINSNI